MPHPKKKQRLTGDDAHYLVEAVAGQMTASAGDLSVELLADIFGFLAGATEMMQRRLVCKKWKEAVKITIVPLTEFSVVGVRKYNAMNVMTRAMPYLQQITLGSLGCEHKYSDGEDPNEEEAARTAHYTTHGIEIIRNFRKLREFAIYNASLGSPLNGRYPFLFNSFPLLQKLSIKYCHELKWDLGMLAGFPLLKELYCCDNNRLTGNITSLRVLKDTLEKVKIQLCRNVEGNFMDLADFPHLKKLDLDDTDVTGDIRDIGDNDFLSLKQLTLPKGVYGGKRYELQRISDGPDLVRAVYLLKKQRPFLEYLWYAMLSEDSPDWYDIPEECHEILPYYICAYDETPPFHICFVKAGSRTGYRWETKNFKPCEVNWLDPEPDRESSDYGKYVKKLQEMNSKVEFFKGFHQPPTEEEYNRLCDRFEEEGRWW
jgi:hypothetical protein